MWKGRKKDGTMGSQSGQMAGNDPIPVLELAKKTAFVGRYFVVYHYNTDSRKNECLAPIFYW